jgi:flagellar hook-basal body complex protein FliE
MLKTNQSDLVIQTSSIKDELKQLEQNTSTFREELNKKINELKNQTENSKTELDKLKEGKTKILFLL